MGDSQILSDEFLGLVVGSWWSHLIVTRVLESQGEVGGVVQANKGAKDGPRYISVRPRTYTVLTRTVFEVVIR